MKRLPLILLSIFAAALLCSCTTTNSLNLTVTPTQDSQGTQGSSAIAAMSDGELQMVVASSNFDGRNAEFMVSLATSGESTFTFRESDLSLYGGNYQTGQWELISVWDSNTYTRNVNAGIVGAGILIAGAIGTIAILDAILNDGDSYIDFGYTYFPSPYYSGRYGYSFWTDDPAVLATFIALDTIENALAMNQLADMQSAELSSTLLQSGFVSKSSKLAGLVSFSGIPKYPDYKLSYRSTSENMEFIFSRSDRAEIVDPWKEKSHPIFALNYNYTLLTKRNSVTLSILAPKDVGVFAGVSFFPPLKFEKQEGMVGAIAGLTWKILPFFWLEGGAEVQWQPEGRGHDILGIFGIEYCINHYSLRGAAIYSKDEKSWYAELGLGVAFF